MKASLFLMYPLRSLRRGGISTVLAIVCIAIGVMAVVAIQLVGTMAVNSYVNNARLANGGDISLTVGDPNTPITQSDLSFFDQLKHAQTITDYTPVNIESGIIDQAPAPPLGLFVQIIDPQHFPLVTAPTFVSPPSGSLAGLLTANQVVVTQTFLTQYHKQLGDTFTLQIQSQQAQSRPSRTLRVRLAGVIANAGGMYPAGNTFILVSFTEYQAASPSVPITYNSIDITTQDQTHMTQATSTIQQQVQQGHFPLVTVQTVADLQQHVQAFTDQETQLQELVGLLALLIGGLGILNTMRVLLSRRTTEIAMLKTTGYSWNTLALLFAVETGVLGLIGGIFGTGIALVVSYGVVTTLLDVPFQPDLLILGGGILLGAVTALSFGLLPIVQSAAIRPIQVMREHMDSGSANIQKSTIILYCIIVIFFCLQATIILQNVLLACASVCGTVLFLLFLGLCFRPIIWGISIIPIPEQYSAKYLRVVLSCMVLSALLCVFLPVVGGVALAFLFLSLLIKWLPQTWKINIRMALRNIGRSPTRTTMLMLILFVGIFVIGSIQMIGQDLQSQLASTMNQTLTSNVVAKVPQNQAGAMQTQLRKLPSLLSSHSTIIGATTLVAINSRSWQSILADPGKDTSPIPRALVLRQVLRTFDGVEGYDLAHQQVPDPHTFQIMAGRNLNASDAQTQNILIPYAPAQTNMLSLSVGSTITLSSSDGKASRTLTVIGEYLTSGISIADVSPILTSQNIVSILTPTTRQTVFYLKVDPAQVAQAEASIQHAVPVVTFVQTPASNVNGYLQVVSTITVIFTVLALFVLLAGIVIMANAIVLDLLARRRELGILKAIGYSQKTLQGGILLEYGIIGGLSAILAILLITLLTDFLGNIFLHVTSTNLGVNGATVPFTFSTDALLLVSLLVGALLLVLITSLLACWKTVRIRPLDILRYE